MNDFAKIFGIIFAFLAGVIFLSFLLAFPVKWLWNGCLVGAIDGVNQIGVLQAWGIGLLASLMFKSSSTSK